MTWRLVIIVYGALIAAVMAVTVFSGIYIDRRLAEDAALRRIESTSRILEEHAARSFGEIVLAIEGVRSAVIGHPELGRAGSPEIRSLLLDRLEGAGVAANLFIAGPDGKIIHAARSLTREGEPAGGLAATLEAVLRESTSRAGDLPTVSLPVISLPVQTEVAGRFFVLASLRLIDAAGRYRGSVSAMIPSAYFDTLYGAAQSNVRHSIVLWRRDGSVLFRRTADDELTGGLVPWERLRGNAPVGVESGAFREQLPDGRGRIVSWGAVSGWPFVVSVAAVDTDYLESWRRYAWRNGLLAGIGFLIVLALTAMLARHAEKLSQARAEIEATRRRLADAIESLPDAFILFDRDDRLVTVNQKFRDYFSGGDDLLVPGTTYEQILRHGLEQGHYPAAVGREEAWLAEQLAAHREPGAAFELALADGRWFRVSERRTGDEGIVGIRVDITDSKRAERKLQDSERQAQAIMDATVDGLVMINGAGIIERTNRSVTSLFGYRGEDLIGRDAKELLAEPFRSLFDEHRARHGENFLARLIGGGREVTAERMDGSVFPADIATGELMLDGSRRFIVAIRDISDRVRVQAMLHEAIDSTSDGFVYFDADDRLVMCNSKYVEAYAYLDAVPKLEGLRFEEIARLGLAKGYFADPLAKTDPEAWIRLAQEQRRAPPDAPILTQLSDGRWLLASDRRTPSGGLVGVRIDVTDRIRVEQALRESERRFRLLVDGARDYAIVMLDPEGKVTSWNEGARQITGYEAGDIIGWSHELFWPQDRIAEGAPVAALRAARDSGRYAVREQRMRSDGKLFWADVVISRIDDDEGRLSGFANIMHDVTERITIEEQLAQAQKMEAVGQLTGGLAHDFNNLLQVVITNLEFVLDGSSDPAETGVRANDALRAAERGAELTSQMLAYARRQRLTPRRTDLQALIEDLAGLLRRTLGENIVIELGLADKLRDVMIDRGQLESALLNLSINARDAMPQGGRLRISAENVDLDDDYIRHHPEARRGRYVRISIADTGMGMSPEVRAHAFEPFFTTKEVGKGSGLGLSMVYGFVKQSGGHVQLDSVLGQGTTLMLYLPEAPAADASDRVQVMAPAAMPGGDETVLVVEDNPDVRRLAVTLLKGLGYHVLEAANGTTALSLLEDKPDIKLLLTDVMLAGGISGPDVARQARTSRPGLRLAYMSGYAGGATGGSALDPEVPLISKPFTRATLARGIRTALDAG
ncbi:MAG: PAS domain S-box protein [Alphaproteobacteria bacterium]|nr:PAS domain S-box protein [Alphaproteobacteria bacterium]